MKTSKLTALSAMLGALLTFHSTVLAQGPSEAEDDGLGFARNRVGSRYDYSLLTEGRMVFGPTQAIIKFDVQAGVDYALVTGRDSYVADIDIYIVGEYGSLIVKDDRSGVSRGAVRWRSQFTGTATAYIQIKRLTSQRPGSFASFLGISQIKRTPPAAPRQTIDGEGN